MAEYIEIKGFKIELGKLYYEYTEEERKLLPPLEGNKIHCRFNFGEWWLDEDCTLDYDPIKKCYY